MQGVRIWYRVRVNNRADRLVFFRRVSTHNRVSLESADEMSYCSTHELEFRDSNEILMDPTMRQEKSRRNTLKSTAHVLLTMNLDHQQENETQNRNRTKRFHRARFLVCFVLSLDRSGCWATCNT
jgi:hypothetical protein